MESVILIRNILYQIRYDVEDPQLGADSGKRNSLCIPQWLIGVNIY